MADLPPPMETLVNGPIRAARPWLSESFRLAINRAGHFLPIIVLFNLSIGLLTAFSLWFGFKDSSITVDADAETIESMYGGSAGWLLIAGLSIPVSAVLTALGRGAIARQAWAAQAGAPEPWSESLQGVLSRACRVVPVAIGRAVIYLVLAMVLLGLLVAAPGLALLAPLVLIAMFTVWVRLCFIGQTAALAGPEHGAYATSFRLSRLQLGPLVGRLLLVALAGIGLIIVSGFIGAPFTSIARGGEATTADLGADTIRSEDIFGPNVMAFAIGSLFGALGLGANYVLTTVGTTLLYRNLGGPIGSDEPGGNSGGDPGGDQASMRQFP